MPQPLVSIIILNYNAGQILLDCFESVIKTNYDNFEIIIVDNASKDKSHRKCKEKFERVRIIENEKNLGYCEGNNVGIKNSKGEFIVILNPDTTVHPDWLNELFCAYNKFGEGLYQPKHLSLSEKNSLHECRKHVKHFWFWICKRKRKKR